MRFCSVYATYLLTLCCFFNTTREKRYDDNTEAMLECVRISHSNAWSKDPMMQLKVTALLSPELCVRRILFGWSEPTKTAVHDSHMGKKDKRAHLSAIVPDCSSTSLCFPFQGETHNSPYATVVRPESPHQSYGWRGTPIIHLCGFCISSADMEDSFK